ncbi:polysaccharide pyruvyl transferase family protein [Dietzia sp. NCCP-2495]|uniref:polysaccharide pyruvyl transferase family protein n=1 Tax=Dietzia sp. NCCP-2495 TaxID=2934675 RepID=UPI00222FF850|nr:polysaccharide pyruvyl transferase family protein [Dietzia sp. NCCP-2495]
MSTPPRRAVSAAARVTDDVRLALRRRLDSARAAADARWGRPRAESGLIYLVAPAGHPNHGDEQLLAGWLRYLRRHRPGAPVVVDCHTPGQAAVLHHGEHPDVLFTDTLWRLAAEHAGPAEPPASDRAAASVEFCRRAVDDLGTRPVLASGINLLRGASVIHLIGGGYVNDQWPHHLGVVAGAGEAGRLGGASVVATGQGFAPCHDPAVLADALRGFSLVTVRDAASRDLLSGTDVPVRLVGDDGWLALSGGAGFDAPDHPVYSDDPDAARELVVCAQSDLVDPAVLADALARILAAWKISGGRITVVESIPGGDRVVWDLVCARAAAARDRAPGSDDDNTVDPADIADRVGPDPLGHALAELDLSQARFVPFQQVWASGLPARAGQVWLSTRFHPHLFGAARGASGLVLRGGTGYYDVKHGSLVAAGSPWGTVDAGEVAAGAEVPPLPAGGGFSEPAVDALISAAEALADDLYPRP